MSTLFYLTAEPALEDEIEELNNDINALKTNVAELKSTAEGVAIELKQEIEDLKSTLEGLTTGKQTAFNKRRFNK